jgi:hypothetical protein
MQVIMASNRNKDVFMDAPVWSRPIDQMQYFADDEVASILSELGVEQGYPPDSVVSGIRFAAKNWQHNKHDNVRHRRLLCYYNTSKRGGCGFVIRHTYRLEWKDNFFQVGDCEHVDHKASPNVKARQLLNSPSVLCKTPREFGRDYTRKNPDSTHKDLKVVDTGFKRIKYSHSIKGLPKGVSPRCRAAVLTALTKYRYSMRSLSSSFDGDTVYLCADHSGKDFILDDGNDEEEARVVAVLSTEELLLNLYRQMCSGQDVHFQIDASYRYTTIKNLGYIPVKVSSLTQTGRSVAYAIITKEDGSAHKYIVEAIKASLVAVVNRRIARGDKFV